MRVEDVLKKRRDRAIAIIMNVKERDVDPLLEQIDGGERAKRALRKVILDQINDFYNMALDVASSGEAAGYEFNAEVWEQRLEGLEDRIIEALNTRSA